MHFYYLDEAGCTGDDLENQEQPVFVLGGISLRDEGWNKTQQDYFSIIERFFGTIPADFELHTGDLLSPRGNGFFEGYSRERRNQLALEILNLISSRSHSIHLIGIEKSKMLEHNCHIELPYNTKVPYLVSYDYLITYINWFIKEKLGSSARGLIILDEKEQYQSNIERITQSRRYEGTIAHRVKWIVEFSYPIDSQKNPMIQMSDLVVFCAKKFMEVELGYRENWTDEAKNFFAQCYSIIHDRIDRKSLVERPGRNMSQFNSYLEKVYVKIPLQWKRKYSL